ncbi:MAG: succinyldiaminopimelate transaminase [Gammaproteobacteria bacterium]|nr:succinyldiaminopimelate transaminase [Gammaproteobacteria bacterium]
MNRNLSALLPYPFERLDALKEGIRTESNLPHVSLALGEPNHDPPDFVIECLTDPNVIHRGLTTYPPTRGGESLREAIALWLKRRYFIDVEPDTSILPVNGTREALFSLGQAVLSGDSNSMTVLPNPFYQIYEGAAFLRGSTPYYVPATERPEIEEVPTDIWQRAELVYVCSPGNPTGYVTDRELFAYLIEKAQEHEFIVASDECYSEVYVKENEAPVGLLEVAASMGLPKFNRCVAFNSLSKRSNCPGLRSGFVAGDPLVIEQYYNYRTYHGCAMPVHVQAASERAWSDEEHVVENRAVYRRKFEATQATMSRTFGAQPPDGAFYYWPDVGIDDELFATELFRRENITVLPGKYLGRTVSGHNPGSNRIRVALVAPHQACVDAIHRLCRAAQEIR